MKTNMRRDSSNREALARIAADELGGASQDEVPRVVLFEHESMVALSRLASEFERHADYLSEAAALAEADVSIAK